MSNFELLNASCADQVADAVVNAANSGLWEGGGETDRGLRIRRSIIVESRGRKKERYRYAFSNNT